MKTEIIPTILVNNFEEAKKRIKAVEKYVHWVQLDVMDGVFVNNKTWNEPLDLRDFKTRAKLEVHLMIQKPEEVIDDWLEAVERIIIHYESSEKIEELIEKVHKNKKEIGIALNPETRISVLEPFLPRHGKGRGKKDLDLILFMTVQPGWGGQEFKEEVLAKIKDLRKLWPKGNIEVDGGMNPENAQKAVKSGANMICAGTYIFKNKNIKQAIEDLKKLI